MIEFYQKTGGIDDFEKKSSIGLSKRRILWVKKDQESQIEKIGCFSSITFERTGKQKQRQHTIRSCFFLPTLIKHCLEQEKKNLEKEHHKVSKVFNKMVPEEGVEPHIHGIPDPKSGK